MENKKGKLSSTHLQPDQHPPSGRSQIPGATPRQETYLKSPHLYTTETPGPQDQGTILDHRQTLTTIAEQQTNNLQGDIETGMDLWNRAMGMRFTIKYSKNPEIPVQNLRLITNAAWFVTNQILHQDLFIEKVRNVFRVKAAAHHKTLSEHPNPLMGPLTDQSKQRRLKRS